MWHSSESKPGSQSESSDTHDLWWSDPSRSGEHLDDLFNEYLNSNETTKEPTGSIDGVHEGQDKSFKSRVSAKNPQPQTLTPSTAGLGFELVHAEESQPNDARRLLPPWSNRLSIETAQTAGPRHPLSNLSTNVLAEEPSGLTRFDPKDVNQFNQPTSPIIRLDPSPSLDKQPISQPSRYKAALTSSTLNYNIKSLKPAKRSFSAIQQYRQLDDRQARRPPLYKRRASYNTALGESDRKPDPMLATSSSSHGYDLSPEFMGYQPQDVQSYFLNKDSMTGPRTSQMPISPPLSSARSSFLTPRNGSVNYNLSTESLPSYGQPMNSLSRPHSMPRLQDQGDVSFDAQPRGFVHHAASTEYLSHQDAFDEELTNSHPSLSTYSSFTAPYSLPDSLEMDTAGSTSSSVQGSSPQPWWDQNANLEFQQDTSTTQYFASSQAGYGSVSTMSPTKRSFNPITPGENLHPLLYIQTQPRSPISEQERMYAHIMDRNHSTHSSIPSPPGSPGYFFSPAMSQDGFFAQADSAAVQFVDPFNHHQDEQHGSYLKTPTASVYDVAPHSPTRQISSLNPAAAHASHHISRPATRPTYARKLTNPSRVPSISVSSRIGSISGTSNKSRDESKEVSFVNFTPHDAGKILSGVAPSGSSKTKARREREALERRRKLSEAAAAAVLAAGGDPSNFPLDF